MQFPVELFLMLWMCWGTYRRFKSGVLAEALSVLVYALAILLSTYPPVVKKIAALPTLAGVFSYLPLLILGIAFTLSGLLKWSMQQPSQRWKRYLGSLVGLLKWTILAGYMLCISFGLGISFSFLFSYTNQLCIRLVLYFMYLFYTH